MSEPDDMSGSGGSTGGARKPLGGGKPLARRPLKKAGAEAVDAPASSAPDPVVPVVPALGASPVSAEPVATTAASAASPASPAVAPTPAKAGGSGGVGKLAAGPKAAVAAFGVFVVLGIGYFAVAKPGAGGEMVMGSSSAKSAASAMGLKETPCKDAKNERVTPLVIDWTSEERTELELAMKDNLAVIEYSCDRVRVLPDCRVEGAYKFTGVQPKEEVRQLANADEFRANLPKSATGKVAASAGVEMDRGTTLDIATVTIGRKRTVVDSPTTKDLKGKCDGASHIVRGASVGAFAKDAGQKGKLKTSAEMFGAGSSLNSTASAFARSVDGSIDACRKADADGVKPPPQCGSVVSLELLPVLGQEDVHKAGEARDSAEAGSCPVGMVYANAKCVKKEDATSFQCEADEFDVCKAQCEKGNAGSCLLYGDMISDQDDPFTEEKNPHYDEAGGDAAYKKACDAGVEGACAMRVMNQLEEGTVTGAQATTVLEKAVVSGDNRARWVYGIVLTGLADRSEKTKKPYGIKLDATRGVSLLSKACQGGDAWGCGMLGMVAITSADSPGMKKLPPEDVAYAMKSNGQLCKPSSPLNCIAAAGLVALQLSEKVNGQDMSQTAKDVEKAIGFAKIPCDAKKNEVACGLVKSLTPMLAELKKKL